MESEIRNITRILRKIATSVGWNEGGSTIHRYLFAMKFTVSGETRASVLRGTVLSTVCLCAHAEERYWYKQGAGPVWSVLCNQAPITIEGGQSSSWTLAGTTLFQAIRLLARFCFNFLPPWIHERYGGEAADTGLGCRRAHICLPVSLEQKWQINVNRDEQR